MKINFQKIPFVLSIVFLLSACFAFIFLYGQIINNNSQAEVVNKEWGSEFARREEIKSLDRSLRAVDAGKVALESHFAKSTDAVPFLDTIESLAVVAGAQFEIISVEEAGTSGILVLDVKSKGSFESIYKFLTLLENSPYEIEFTSVNVTKPLPQGGVNTNTKNADWEGLLTMRLLTYVK
ncbi:MAG: hypothetical protein KBD55_01320 [Candidatus Pacebacteria bacterium]|nr:hypothetical protein [Candidatus Paceibacterota bacterium]